MPSVRTQFARLSWWLALRLELMGSEQEEYRGLRLVALDRGTEDYAPLWFEKVRRAIALIDRHSPQVARRLRMDVDRVVVDPAGGPEFNRAIRAIRLFAGSLQTMDVARIAMVIVHEATHARIAARGIAYSPDQRGRHERLCVKAEARFAARLPGDRGAARDEMRKLQQRWWSDAALKERREREEERVRTLGLAEFDRLELTGPIARFLRRRIAKE